MQVQEEVSVVCAFPGVSSLCAFGCPSGRIGVFDCETNQVVYSHTQSKPVISMAIDEENILYVADSQRVFRHDTKAKDEPVVQFQTLSEISHIAVNGTSICATTQRHGVSVADGRNIQRMITETQPNSIPPNQVHFIDDGHFVTGYDDANVVIWSFLSEESRTLEVPKMLTNRKLKPLGITSFTRKDTNIIAVGYESGVSVYENDVFKDHMSFEQRGRFGAISLAPCFGQDYLIAVVDDSSLVPCSISQGPAEPKVLHGAEICSVSANHFMLYVADKDEEGYIGVLLPESFGDQFY